jgi:hypothetical protein
LSGSVGQRNYLSKKRKKIELELGSWKLEHSKHETGIQKRN